MTHADPFRTVGPMARIGADVAASKTSTETVGPGRGFPFPTEPSCVKFAWIAVADAFSALSYSTAVNGNGICATDRLPRATGAATKRPEFVLPTTGVSTPLLPRMPS